MFEKLVCALYPKTCPLCGKIMKPDQMVCPECQNTLFVDRRFHCLKCGKILPVGEAIYCDDCNKTKHYFERGVALFAYCGKTEDSLYRFKYGNQREYADFYATIAVSRYGSLIQSWKIETIIPVPIHRKKKIRRGYNQAVVFAKSVSEKLNIPMDSQLLIRKSNTTPQKGLTRQKRYQNLKSAFAVHSERCHSFTNVLLVDDIYTTGSTMDACSQLLRATGIQSVYFLCIASGIGDETG